MGAVVQLDMAIEFLGENLGPLSNAGPSLLRALGAKANVPIGVAHQHIAHEAVRLSWPDLSAGDPAGHGGTPKSSK